MPSQESSSSDHFTLVRKTSRVLEDQLDLILASGWTPSGMSGEAFRSAYLDPKQRQALSSNPDLSNSFVHACRTLAIYRHAIAERLDALIASPDTVVEGHAWKQTQSEYLQALAWGLRHGYMHLLAKVPTGGGKSHALGAVIRSIIDARTLLRTDPRLNEAGRRLLALKEEAEIVVLTSRRNLVHQLIAPGSPVAVSENGSVDGEAADMDDEEEVTIGDIRQWIQDVIPDEQMRVLVTGATQAEREKDARFTIQTYQGVTLRRLHEIHRAPVVALFADESHNLTGPKGTIIRQGYPAALRFGVSATPQGPDRNPFNPFEPVIRQREIDSASQPWHEGLVYHATMADLIRQGELKPLRWISADTGLSLDGVSLDDPEDVIRFFKRNLGTLQGFIHHIFTKRHPVLELSRSRPLRERRHIFFFEGLDICREMVPFIQGFLPADMTSGEDSEEVFNRKKQALKSGALRALISDTKLREGFDVDVTDCIWIMRPHNKAWILEQEIGRGERLIAGDPQADNLVIEPFFNGDHHALSVLDLFGSTQSFDGGLLAAPRERSRLEGKICSLLREGHTLRTIRDEESSLLTSEEREELDLWWGRATSSSPVETTETERDIDRETLVITDIQLVEREDVQRRLIHASAEHLRVFLRKQFTPETWAAMQVTVKQSLVLAGKKYGMAIATLFGLKGDPTRNHPLHLAIGRLVWGEDEALKEPENIEIIREQIKDDMRERFTAQTWAEMTKKNKRSLVLAGKKYGRAIATLFGVKGHPSNNHSFHLAIGRLVWGEDEALKEPETIKITRELIEADIRKRFIPKTWAEMKATVKQSLVLAGKKYGMAIATLFGLKGDPTGNHPFHLAIGRLVWGEDEALKEPENIEIIREQIKDDMRERFTAQTWAEMTKKNRRSLVLAGKKYGRAIATLFGLKGNPSENYSFHLAIGRLVWG